MAEGHQGRLAIEVPNVRSAEARAALRPTHPAAFEWRIEGAATALCLVPKEALHPLPGSDADPLDDTTIGPVQWSRMPPICVTELNGWLWIIDGKRRWRRAMADPAVTVIPCAFHRGVSPKWVEQPPAPPPAPDRTRRPKLRAYDGFMARLAAGDPTARECHELVKQSGRSPAPQSGPKVVSCVVTMEDCFRANPSILRRVWPVFDRLCIGQQMEGDLLSALFRLEQFAGDGCSIAQQPWRDRIIEARFSGLKEAMADAKIQTPEVAAPCSGAFGIFNRINHRVRTQPFEVRGSLLTGDPRAFSPRKETDPQ